jgi:hypothetical protein
MLCGLTSSKRREKDRQELGLHDVPNGNDDYENSIKWKH